MIAKTLFNRSPLIPNRFAPLPLSALRPEGWLLDQLRVANDGVCGHLVELLPETGDLSTWYGGNLQGTLAPNALRAQIEFAFLLGDEAQIKSVSGRVHKVLASQAEDGSFGPADSTFISRGEMIAALWQYYTATATREVMLFLMRYFKYLLSCLDEAPLDDEQSACTADTLYVALNLYNLTGRKGLLDVCERLVKQGTDWTSYFHTFSYRLPMKKHTPPHEMREGLERSGDEGGYFEQLKKMTTAKNIADGLRVSTLSYSLTGSSKHGDAYDVGFSRLMKHHGTACGCFTGDPLINGAHPSQGVDALCVAKMISSLQTILWTQDCPQSVDAFERIAYNALPAIFTTDMRAFQCVQQANQVRISREKRNFYAEDDTVNLFSASGDPEVLTAISRSWSQVASSQWMLTRDGGLAAIGYAPCVLRYRLGDTAIKVRTHSAYPFDGAIRITLSLSKSTAFPLYLHIPQWASGATVAIDSQVICAKEGTFEVLGREWHDGDEILVNLPMGVRTDRWYHSSASVERGPLVFALNPEEKWVASEDDTSSYSPQWSIYATSDWNGALAKDARFDVNAQPKEAAPFGHGCPVQIETDITLLPDWEIKDASSDQPPIASSNRGEVVHVQLSPYGACALRISQFPVI